MVDEVSQELIRKVMGQIGSIKSPKKARASRRNGKLGGRPKKKKAPKKKKNSPSPMDKRLFNV